MIYYVSPDRQVIKQIRPIGQVLPNGVRISNIPANPAEWAALNIYDSQQVGNHPDGRYYSSYENITFNEGLGRVDRTVVSSPKPVADVKTAKKLEVEEKMKAVMRGGVTILTKPIATDQESVDKFSLIGAALSLGEPYPGGGIVIYTMTGERVNMTEAQFKDGLSDIARHFIIASNNAASHMAAIEALSTHADVVNYDYSTGWPSNPEV